MRKILFLATLAVFVLSIPSARAEDETIFDSTSNYLGSCAYTDTSTWTLDQAMNVTTFQIWYYWQTNETELPITVTKDGAAFDSFTATRGSCDPYQASWCNADYAINKTLPAGTYTTKIANAYQCMKPGGTGTVRLYGTAEPINAGNANLAATTASNTNSAANANVNRNANAAATSDDTSTDSMTMWYVIIAVAVIIIFVCIFWMMSKKKRENPPATPTKQ